MTSRLWLALTFPVFSCLLIHCGRQASKNVVMVEAEPTVNALIDTFLDGSDSQEVLFAEVVKAATGTHVIPMDPNEEVDAQILDELGVAMEEALDLFNLPSSPNRSAGRINEMGPHLENALHQSLNRSAEFSCDFARNREGIQSRAGYPDLKLIHKASGRVVYLEAKLAESSSLHSNLKTFYYTPRGPNETILSDAHHLMLSVEHDGNTGNWKFTGWQIIDLALFKVRLKAEFHAENKDVYRPELTIRKKP